MVNCAHPTHFQSALDRDAPWIARIRGVRANASRLSHAELDEATELDRGDIDELAGPVRSICVRARPARRRRLLRHRPRARRGHRFGDVDGSSGPMSTAFTPYVECHGNGEPIVLVHGGWTDHDTWQFVVPELAADHLVVTYDRRGHSRSVWNGPAPRRTDEDDLVEIIQRLDRGPVHLVGNSYGASIVLTVAARRPGLVRSVNAHEPPLLGVGRPGTELGDLRVDMFDALQGVAADLERGQLEAGAERFVDQVALGPGAWQMLPESIRATMVANASTFLNVLRDPQWDAITEVPDRSVPVMLTDGTDSPPWLPAVVRGLAVVHYRHAERYTFDGAGHVPHLTHPAELVAQIRSFIRSSTAASVALASVEGGS